MPLHRNNEHNKNFSKNNARDDIKSAKETTSVSPLNRQGRTTRI